MPFCLSFQSRHIHFTDSQCFANRTVGEAATATKERKPAPSSVETDKGPRAGFSSQVAECEVESPSQARMETKRILSLQLLLETPHASTR